MSQFIFRISLPLNVLKRMAKQQGREVEDIWQKNIVDRYWTRPTTETFQDMCLADFAAWYRLANRKQNVENDENNTAQTTVEDSIVIKLLDDQGSITKRKKSAVIRYRKISKSKDSEQHYATLMRMYLPHRGKQLKPEESMYEDFYMNATL